MECPEAPGCYRLYAARCVEIAQQTSDPGNKASLLAMVQCWLALADQADKTGGLGLDMPVREVGRAVQQQQQPQPRKD
jgi:hypothetical protein